MRRLADAIEARSAEVARRVSDQNGMPIILSMATEAHAPSQILRYYADLISQEAPRSCAESSSGGSTLVRRSRSVSSPRWRLELPEHLAALKYAPALAAGCTVVLKPSPETVLDAFLVAEAR